MIEVTALHAACWHSGEMILTQVVALKEHLGEIVLTPITLKKHPGEIVLTPVSALIEQIPWTMANCVVPTSLRHHLKELCSPHAVLTHLRHHMKDLCSPQVCAPASDIQHKNFQGSQVQSIVECQAMDNVQVL